MPGPSVAMVNQLHSNFLGYQSIIMYFLAHQQTFHPPVHNKDYRPVQAGGTQTLID